MTIETSIMILPAEKKGWYPTAEVDPAIADQLLPEGKNKHRIIVSFPNGKHFHRALQCSKDGFCHIIFGKSTMKDAGVEFGESVLVKLKEDTSEFGMPFPEEFQEVLNQEPESNTKFLALNPGMRRSLLYHINSAKTVETRIKRALDIAYKLKTDTLYSQRNKP
jgi:hypothetical protein